MTSALLDTPPVDYDQAMAALGRDIRTGQRTLVEHGIALEPGHHLLVKAPTATGKTLAALMIAGFRHSRGLGRTVIATFTRILQDQYADKDLADAQRLFPSMPIAILKGANNYVCRERAAKIENLSVRKDLRASVGDPGEVRHNPEMWPAKADATECKEHNPSECGYAAAKARARGAHCVITNHTLVLLAADMPQILGPHSMLVMDECFVPSALIDTPTGPRPVGDLQEGDQVYGFDETTSTVTLATVEATMRKDAEVIGGFVTSNHPVRVVGDAYRPVADLTAGDHGLVLTPPTTGNPDLPGVQRVVLGRGAEGGPWSQVLQQIMRGPVQDRDSSLEQGHRVIGSQSLSRLHRGVHHPTHGHHPVLQPSVLLGQRRPGVVTEESSSSKSSTRSSGSTATAPDLGLESVHQTGDQSQGTCHAPRWRLDESQWGQRDTDHCTGTSPYGISRFRLGNRAGHTDQGMPTPVTALPLQGGPRTGIGHGGRGSRRLFTSDQVSEGVGQEEGPSLDILGMDGSEVQQPRDRVRYERVRSDHSGDRQPVVNIQTSTGNYFVHGLLVHNCHNFPRAAESFASREIDLAELIKEAVQQGDRDLAEIISAAERCLEPGSATGNREPSGQELQALSQLPGIDRCREIFDWAMDAIAQKKHQHPQRMSTVAQQLRKWPSDKRVLKSTWIDVSVVAARGLATELSFTNLRTGDEQTYERAVLMMSATTGTPAHPAYVAERCGLAKDVPLLSVESSLDYANQMRVSLLEVPMRWSTEDAVLQLVKETEGRTLVLCRSWKSVDMIQQRLYRETDFPYAVHVQSKQNPTDNGAIVGRFRADPSSVLIGTASLFEGIDVAGESLSQVVIVQLPILMTMDPLWAERERRAGKRWFPDHQIPSTALILEQMIGRLIRRTTDRGLVAILDPAARRTWGYQAATHALHSFGVRDVSRRNAKEWFVNATVEGRC